MFKLTRASQPADLDDFLAARGYGAEAVTSVQVADLSDSGEPATARCGFAGAPTDTWLDDVSRLNAIAERDRHTLRAIVERISLPAGFATLRDGGRAVACGLGVVQDEWLGLYDIVTDPAMRGRGHGRQLVQDLLAWGRGQGARRAYLLVMADNTPALRLHAGAGFAEVYKYWYRVK